MGNKAVQKKSFIFFSSYFPNKEFSQLQKQREKLKIKKNLNVPELKYQKKSQIIEKLYESILEVLHEVKPRVSDPPNKQLLTTLPNGESPYHNTVLCQLFNLGSHLNLGFSKSSRLS